MRKVTAHTLGSADAALACLLRRAAPGTLILPTLHALTRLVWGARCPPILGSATCEQGAGMAARVAGQHEVARHTRVEKSVHRQCIMMCVPHMVCLQGKRAPAVRAMVTAAAVTAAAGLGRQTGMGNGIRGAASCRPSWMRSSAPARRERCGMAHACMVCVVCFVCLVWGWVGKGVGMGVGYKCVLACVCEQVGTGTRLPSGGCRQLRFGGTMRGH